MSQGEEFLVVGAELKCSCGTITCKLKEGKNCTTIRIRDRVFLPIQARKEGENIEGFGMCLSKKCTGGTIPCTARMILANEWINPITLNSILMIQGEEAIHRYAQLICVSGQASIQALTTGQEKLTKSEKKFYQYMHETFGFDLEIIIIMLKVIYAIDEAYPSESERKKAWRFARLMGGFSYGFGEDNKFIEIRNELKEENAPVDSKKIESDIFKWNVTAGEYKGINDTMSEKDYFVNKLHLSEAEYYKLRFHVMAQHEITSRPAGCFPPYMSGGIKGIEVDENGEEKEVIHRHPYYEVWKDYFKAFDAEENFAGEWSRLYYQYVNISDDFNKELPNQWMLFSHPGNIDSDVEAYITNLEDSTSFSITPVYTDFSHQQILTATITLDDVTADKLLGSFVSGAVGMYELRTRLPHVLSFWAGKKTSEIVNSYRTSLAGWLGDMRLVDSKMSEDDYKADLDGLNVSNLIIKEDINTVEAINEYYEALESGEKIREKEFLCNMGNGDALEGYNNIRNMDRTISMPQQSWSALKQIWDTIKNGEELEFSEDEVLEEFMNRIAVGLE
ncbi:MAG: DUF4280 domain-containing protein [Eubacterium sp.]|nr:DUF4280 domain-containing protein [Eubacterium sp.]